MKKIYCLLLSACLFSCTDDLDNLNTISDGVVELTGIEATIETGAAPQTRAVTYLSDAISRYQFEDEDRMTFTTIKRTANPLANFNYVGVEFQSNSSGAWDRDKMTGSLIGSTDGSHPERVYWSDASSDHTFIGYSLPKLAPDEPFDWENIGEDKVTYYGSIGDKDNISETIDFNSLANSTYTQAEIDAAKAIVEKVGYVSGTDKTAEAIAAKTVGTAKPYESEMVKRKVNGKDVTVEMPISSKMRAEDLLLTYSTNLVADASVAKVKFYHALSSIKVQVSISGYYGSEIDGYTIVENMKLLHQPTLYKWNQTSAGVTAKSNTHSENNPKDMKLWDYVPEGSGSGAGKTFSFYGITVPQEDGYDFQDLELTFDVKYPDPLKTDLEKVKKGEASIVWIAEPKHFSAKIPKSSPVKFHPGQCTVINLKLNHQDEDMTIGAEYMEWQFISTPDEGSLHKNTTFLQNTERFSVKLSSDNVTQDDATWLYYKQENGAVTEELLDIYGNTGTATSPYKISTADQLLAFAYEVNVNRLNFTGKYVELDADIFMQASADLTIEEMRNAKVYSEKDITDAKAKAGISWIGIGDGTTSFNGTFLGGGRQIARIMGSPLFNTLGANAKIDNLVLSDVATDLIGTGTLANTNNGEIVGCVVNAKVNSTESGAGALVGTNTSTGKIITCYHVGGMEGTGSVSGLVGTNQGTMTGCYNAGTIVSKSYGTCYGVTNNDGGTLTGCYYNKTLAGNLGEGGKTTVEMQKLDFTNSINYSLPTNPQAKYSYKFSATQYPSLVPYNVTKPTLLPDGFYRVKNVGSERYVYVTDNKGSISREQEDLGAIVMKRNLHNAISDPGSIIYVKSAGASNTYNLYSQGTDVKTITNHNTTIYPETRDTDFSGKYRVGATEGELNKYLADITTDPNETGNVSTLNGTIDKKYKMWDAIPVDDASSNYFGLSAASTPSLTKESKTTYYVPFYAGFGFETASRNMEVFYISQMNESEGKVCMKKITGVVPANTPVIVACSSSSASGNRLSLKNNNAAFAPKNFLKGNMFNNTVDGHVNQTAYNPETMRVLEVRDDKLAFVKKTPSELQYLPANTSYLVVSAGAPDVITVETEETYNEPSSTNNNPIASGYYHVQNFGSKRYLSVVDDKVSINVQEVNITHDLNALALNKTLNTSDPGSIVYVTADGDVTSQGVSLRSKIPGFTINERKDADDNTHYRVGAERSGLSRYICDAVTSTAESGKVDTHVDTDKNYLLWDAIAVNTITLPSSSISIPGNENIKYIPFYAEFGLTLSDGMKAYVISKIEEGKVYLTELSGTIPNKTPVIIAYSSSSEITLKYENTTLGVTNLLCGNMFNNSVTNHVNREKTTAKMRVLAVANNKLVFKTPAIGDSEYLPANSSYLEVNDGVPEALEVVFNTNTQQ